MWTLWTSGNFTTVKSAWTNWKLIDETTCTILNNCQLDSLQTLALSLLDKLQLEIYIKTTEVYLNGNSGYWRFSWRYLKGQFNCNGFKIFALPMSFLYKIDLPAAWAHRIFKKPQNQLQTSENLLKVWKFDLKYNKDLKFYLKLKLRLPSYKESFMGANILVINFTGFNLSISQNKVCCLLKENLI